MNELNNNFFQQLLKHNFKTPDQQTRTASQSSSTSATPVPPNQVSLNLPQTSPQATSQASANAENRTNHNLAGQVCFNSTFGKINKLSSSNGPLVNRAHPSPRPRPSTRHRTRRRRRPARHGASVTNTLPPPPPVPMDTISRGTFFFNLWKSIVRSRTAHSVVNHTCFRCAFFH